MSDFNLSSAQRRRLSVLMERHLAALERFREVTERVSFHAYPFAVEEIASALGDHPFRPGSPGGLMKCPTCGQNTPDRWEQYIAHESWVPPQRFELKDPEPEIRQHSFPSRITLDWMVCANKECGQPVVRGHVTYTRYVGDLPQQTTDTWLVYPRSAARPLDSVVLETAADLAADYFEAVAVLDISHRMSAVLARSILADLLEKYAHLTDFRLVDRVDKLIENDHYPFDLRQDLHYLREIADLSAHTKLNDQFEKIEITREEADWTLTIIERLFDYFVISPAKSERLRKGMDTKLEEANRKPITPLPGGSEVPSQGESDEGPDEAKPADREDPEGS